jgi:hypothetical protein
VRGFVQRLEVGRAGLVTVALIHADGSSGQYVITDLDADPERFNERLSKLGVLRDAMSRAEPVEIEHVEGKAGREIDRVARLARDALQPASALQQLLGLVLDLAVTAQNGVGAAGEVADVATVQLVTTDLATRTVVLDLQAPERLVAAAQLDMLRTAQAEGRLVRLTIDTAGAAEPRVAAVAVDPSGATLGGERTRELDGFVESLGLQPATGGGSLGSFAVVRLTTAPPFTGAGNVVAMSAFTPEAVDLLTTKGSLAYDLFEAALRDGLRVHVGVALAPQRGPNEPEEPDRPRTDQPANVPAGREATPAAAFARAAAVGTAAGSAGLLGLVADVQLLAPLASASRPVWVAIERRQLDHGPEGDRCALGSPSSDLTPRTLRDLRLPYPAAWCGVGCFNAGVYRFQLQLASAFVLKVDGEELCLHTADGGVKLAHACLRAGCHEVCVEIEGWTCDSDFVMDVYRLR